MSSTGSLFLTLPELARRWRVGVRTLDRLIEQHGILVLVGSNQTPPRVSFNQVGACERRLAFPAKPARAAGRVERPRAGSAARSH